MDTVMEHFAPQEKLLAQAYLASLYEKYDQAIPMFEGIIEQLPDKFFIISLSEIYLEAGLYEKGVKLLEKRLIPYPNDGETLLNLGMLLNAQGKKEEAGNYLEKALEIWKEADPEFIPAQKARALLKVLSSEL